MEKLEGRLGGGGCGGRRGQKVVSGANGEEGEADKAVKFREVGVGEQGIQLLQMCAFGTEGFPGYLFSDSDSRSPGWSQKYAL